MRSALAATVAGSPMRNAPSGPLARLAVELDQGAEPRRLAADDRHHERQPEGAGAYEGRGRAADPHPHRQGVLERSRVDALAGPRRSAGR